MYGRRETLELMPLDELWEHYYMSGGGLTNTTLLNRVDYGQGSQYLPKELIDDFRLCVGNQVGENFSNDFDVWDLLFYDHFSDYRQQRREFEDESQRTNSLEDDYNMLGGDNSYRESQGDGKYFTTFNVELELINRYTDMIPHLKGKSHMLVLSSVRKETGGLVKYNRDLLEYLVMLIEDPHKAESMMRDAQQTYISTDRKVIAMARMQDEFEEALVDCHQARKKAMNNTTREESYIMMPESTKKSYYYRTWGEVRAPSSFEEAVKDTQHIGNP